MHTSETGKHFFLSSFDFLQSLKLLLPHTNLKFFSDSYIRGSSSGGRGRKIHVIFVSLVVFPIIIWVTADAFCKRRCYRLV